MKKFDSINVIPFIDIMLVLLAIVLATASFITQGKIEVSVPKSDSKISVKADDLAKLITITKGGEFHYKAQYEERQVTLDELDVALKGLTPDTPITIKIDAESDFQQFVSVTDVLAKYKLKKVTVVTDKTTSALSGTP
ncbi:MAG: TonB system transport protein ExbD [Gammaproteobacteria bacterium]|nr:MAG: TonB system transport protein ExbD [Gammaproteobacteria bacterium]